MSGSWPLKLRRSYMSKSKLRSLENYKAMHRAKYPEVDKAETLTEARKICFGVKKRGGK